MNLSRRAFVVGASAATTTLAPVAASAASRDKINSRVRSKLSEMYRDYPFSQRLADQAAGMLMIPRLTKGGFFFGGAYGEGSRMPIRATRALLSAALDGTLNKGQFRKDENFGFQVPVTVSGVDAALLDPRSTWADKDAYDAQAQKLVQMFADNFEQYIAHIDEDVKAVAIG